MSKTYFFALAFFGLMLLPAARALSGEAPATPAATASGTGGAATSAAATAPAAASQATSSTAAQVTSAPAISAAQAAPGLVSQKIAASCECEEIQCAACERQVDVQFYTQKCGAAGSRVKSCKKPVCEVIQALKEGCVATPRDELVSHDQDTDKIRKPAAVAETEDSLKGKALGEPVAKAAIVIGSATVSHINGVSEKAKVNADIYEGDIIETVATGRVKIVFSNTNELNVNASSKVQIESQKFDSGKNKNKTILNLIYGKIRNKVKQKSDQASRDEQPDYIVKTRTAVAGVRGTDFVATFSPGGKKWTTEVDTISGLVDLGGEGQGSKVQVGAGKYAKFEIPAPPKDFDEDDLRPIIAKGELSAVYTLQDQELRDVDTITEIAPDQAANDKLNVPDKGTKDIARNTASTSSAVCKAPAADFNQCSWTCENNPYGEKSCRTDLPKVSCVRRICNANGEWSEMQRLPASRGGECDSNKTMVRPCGDYW